ncbi:MAG: DUF1365 domain-containing protein [Bacteroidota bacterium]|nr:DUF1365 domain-containing protein [Bacteroidota bacterium]
MHHRLEPKQHRFHYNVFMFYIDLDEIDTLAKKLKLFSKNKFNFFSFRDNEHLQLPLEAPDKSKSTKEHILDFLKQNGVNEKVSRMMLLTNLNVLGYNFNPVSFYYCYDEQDQPLCVVAEIGNTFGEMKPFLLTRDNLTGSNFHLNTTKYFYVSPFIDHDTNFDFNLGIPGEKLNIRIDDFKEEKRFFISTLTGVQKPLTNSNLLLYGLRFPLITLKIISLIHWHALKLWLKKIPYRKKAENPELQKDVYRRKG